METHNLRASLQFSVLSFLPFADVFHVPGLSPAAICPFKTLTAWNRGPCGNNREAVISRGVEQAHLA